MKTDKLEAWQHLNALALAQWAANLGDDSTIAQLRAALKGAIGSPALERFLETFEPSAMPASDEELGALFRASLLR